jgi:hypothetical protein
MVVDFNLAILLNKNLQCLGACTLQSLIGV